MDIKYSEVLRLFQPVEEGDFLKIYKLNNGTFVIFRPSEDRLSCIEMLNFNELLPSDLLLILDVDVSTSIVDDEMLIEKTSTKDEVLKYLFDIKTIEEKSGKIFHSVQPFDGYLLNDLSGKFRNIMQSNNTLLFDNFLSFQSNSNHNASQIFIAYDFNEYERLVSNDEINTDYLIYLLPEQNELLFNRIFDESKSAQVKVGNENPLNVLRFLVLLNNRNISFGLTLDFNDKQVALGFKKEIYQVEDVLNMASLVQKEIRGQYGEQLKAVYELKQYNDYCYIIFRNAFKIVYLLNKHLDKYLETNVCVY